MASTLVFAGDASPSTLSGRVARGDLARLTHRRELGDWIDRLARIYGSRLLREIRAEAEQLAPALEVEPERVQQLSDLIGAAVGSVRA